MCFSHFLLFFFPPLFPLYGLFIPDHGGCLSGQGVKAGVSCSYLGIFIIVVHLCCCIFHIYFQNK